jgi:hypothetical protein
MEPGEKSFYSPASAVKSQSTAHPVSIAPLVTELGPLTSDNK